MITCATAFTTSLFAALEVAVAARSMGAATGAIGTRRVHRLPGVAGQALSQAGTASDLRQLPEPTSIPRSNSGWPRTRAVCICTSPRPAPRGLNLVERWFGLITAQAIRRSSFDSVARLEQAITRFLANWNENTKPFRWTKSAHQIKRSIRNAALIYRKRDTSDCSLATRRSTVATKPRTSLGLASRALGISEPEVLWAITNPLALVCPKCRFENLLGFRLCGQCTTVRRVHLATDAPRKYAR